MVNSQGKGSEPLFDVVSALEFLWKTHKFRVPSHHLGTKYLFGCWESWNYLKKRAKRVHKQLRYNVLRETLLQHTQGKHCHPIYPTPEERFISLKMATAAAMTIPNPPHLRRTTISSDPSVSSFSFTQRQNLVMAPKNAQCTHLTMTRLYTSEFRCGVCFRPASMGWVYRCTQDRELLIEEEIEHGEPVSTKRIIHSGWMIVLQQITNL